MGNIASRRVAASTTVSATSASSDTKLKLVPPAGANDVSAAQKMAKKPNAIDVHVGGRIRLRRTMLGISQEKLGISLGITFQQIQKYEKGTNRVGASRLQNISTILQVPVSFFFENAPASEPLAAALPETNELMASIASSEGIALNTAFAKIRDPKVRHKLVELVKALAADSDTE